MRASRTFGEWRVILAISLGGAIGLLASRPAGAAVVVWDQFTGYTAGPISGQGKGSGWTGNWGTDTTFQAVPGAGLALGGATTAPGEVDVTRVGGDATAILRSFATPISSGTIYFCGLMSVSQNTGNISTMNLTTATAASVIVGDFNGGANTNFSLDVRTAGGTDNFFSSALALFPNNVFYLITRIDFNQSGANERIRLYVAPSPAQEPFVAQVDTNANDIGTITGAALFSDQAGTSKFDELRVSTTYAEAFGAVPEPSLSLLSAIGCCGLIARRRHRAHR